MSCTPSPLLWDMIPPTAKSVQLLSSKKGLDWHLHLQVEEEMVPLLHQGRIEITCELFERGWCFKECRIEKNDTDCTIIYSFELDKKKSACHSL